MNRGPLQPTTADGFETGDYRNFAPVYLGTETDWIRPTARVTDRNAIAGEHSLRWTANSDPHRWALVSNAFPLATPVTARTALRVDGPESESYAAGIGFAETQSRAVVLRATASGLELATDAWDGEPVATADAMLDRGRVYRLAVTLRDDIVVATLTDVSGDELARMTATVTVDPHAIGLYVDTVAGGETDLTFDDVTVESGPYRVDSDAWTRSPQFVALPRAPDVEEDQGNWVGAPSVIDEGDRLRMWYRIRNNEERGAGYGLAESADGVEWEKSEANPILVPDHGQSSNEGISVLRVDGTYHAWYTIDLDGTWHVVHATSDDGVDWDDHGIVIEGYCKDPSVVCVDGTYYLYAIAPSNTEFSVYTSDDGQDWTRRNTIDMGAHGHPGAYYVNETETFWLYAFAEEGTASPGARVRRARSDDGIEFGAFESTWHDPLVGLDHRPTGGIDYGAFAGDAQGHLDHDRRVLMYYQARHDYRNNRPGWHAAGDGLVVLGGRFSGLFEAVPTTVDGGRYRYHGFPMHANSIHGLSVAATRPATVTVDRWIPADEEAARGTVETEAETTLTFDAEGLAAETDYEFRVGETAVQATTDEQGSATAEVTVPADLDDGTDLVVQQRSADR